MIPFYVVSALWLVTLAAWMASEKKQSLERMEMLKLFKAHSLTDFNADDSKPRQRNFIESSIKRAYSEMDDGDD